MMSATVFDQALVTKLINLALEEDQAHQDSTSLYCLTPQLQAQAQIVARQELVVCGLPLITKIISCYDANLNVSLKLDEAQTAPGSTVLAELQGSAQAILALERTILNFLQRLSGVATFTKSYTSSTSIKIYDTRKTIPGWRMLDKYAVRTGGGFNHRLNLAELIMVKDTHANAGGGLLTTLTKLFSSKPEGIGVEVEVGSLDQLKDVLKFPINIVMLDNFDNADLVMAVKVIREQAPNVQIEASGGITLARLKDLECIGIDYVSVGALTTQARNCDIAMDILI